MPPKKEMIPRNRSLLEKNRRVRENPIVNTNPVRNKTSPNANSAESKRKRTPSTKKTHPKNKRPVPIFVLSLIIVCFLVSLQYQLASSCAVETFLEKRPEVAMQWGDPLSSLLDK
jgi:hypothetical protein